MLTFPTTKPAGSPGQGQIDWIPWIRVYMGPTEFEENSLLEAIK